MKVKHISNSDLWELQDHRDNTMMELVKWYTLSQLSIMDWKDTQAIKRSWNYIPIRIDTAQSRLYYRNRTTKKPYMTLWIRLDEIKFIFSKRNRGKKLIISQ